MERILTRIIGELGTIAFVTLLGTVASLLLLPDEDVSRMALMSALGGTVGVLLLRVIDGLARLAERSRARARAKHLIPPQEDNRG